MNDEFRRLGEDSLEGEEGAFIDALRLPAERGLKDEPTGFRPPRPTPDTGTLVRLPAGEEAVELV